MNNNTTERRIAVVGAANIDIGGIPHEAFRPADSNPGRVIFTHGGVGRNIVHNLALMGAQVSFVTALGSDSFADGIETELTALGVDMSAAERIPGTNTSTYCYICDAAGDMVAAVCDTGACNLFTPEFLEKRLPLLKSAALIVADANISAEAMRWLVERSGVPVLIDPVSAAKASRVPTDLHGVFAVKPNRIEAELLSGVSIKERADCRKAADVLLSRGSQRVYITLGADGVWCAGEGRHTYLPNIAPALKGATGAGDAFTAGLARAYIDGASLEDAGRLGLAAAAVACESGSAVNPELDLERLITLIHEYGGEYCEQ